MDELLDIVAQFCKDMYLGLAVSKTSILTNAQNLFVMYNKRKFAENRNLSVFQRGYISLYAPVYEYQVYN